MNRRSDSHCANCGAALTGEYCSNCGQKRFGASDRRFGSLLRQFMEAATDLDGRLWGTLRAEPGPLHSLATAPLVDRRVAERDAATRAASGGARGYDYRDYRDAYNAKVQEISKVLTIVHVPLLGVALMLMFRHTGRYFAEHFVVALHLVAFFMAVIVIVDYSRDLLQMSISAIPER